MSKKKKTRIGITLLLAMIGVLLLNGCAGWRGVRDPGIDEAPEHYTAQSDTATVEAINNMALNEPWWKLLNDSTLDSLMKVALSNNLSIAQMVNRLEQSQAVMGAAKSSFLPSINFGAVVSEKGYVEEPAIPNPQQIVNEQPSYNASLSTSYELDVWGKIRSGYLAYKSDHLAVEEEMKSLVLTMSGQVAKSYYLILELRQKDDLLQKTIEAYSNSYELVLERYNRGVVTSLDVYQAKTTLSGAKAQKTNIEASLLAAENAFALLLGQYPHSGIIPQTASMPDDFNEINIGLPNEIVDRRPDVKASLYRMVASDYSAAVAVTNRLPKFSLTASIDKNATEIADLYDPEGMLWNAIGNLTAPLFQGGRLRAEVKRTDAVWKERVNSYRSTLLNAYNEVENALVNKVKKEEYFMHSSEQAVSARATLRLQNDYYLRGVSNYLAVTTAQTAYLNSSMNLISAEREQISSRIDLALAVGGNWMEKIIEENIISDK